MKIVEFFGLPKTGKSLIKSLIISRMNGYKSLSYRLIIAKFLYEKKKISYFEFIFLNHLEYCRERTHYNNFFVHCEIFFKNVFFKILPINKIKVEKEIKLLVKKTEKQNKKFFYYLETLSSKNKKNLNKTIFWIKEEMTGLKLYEKYKDLYFCINSEGIIQRILSLIVRIKLKKSEINKILNFCPNLDLIVILRNQKLEKKNIKKFLISKKSSVQITNFEQNYYYSINQIKKKFSNYKIVNINFKNHKKISNILKNEVLR